MTNILESEIVLEILEITKHELPRLELMDEIGFCAYCELSEDQILEQIVKYQSTD